MQTLLFTDFLAREETRPGGDCARALQAVLAAAKATGAPCTISFPEKQTLHIYKDFCPVREVHTSNTDSLRYPQKTFGILIEAQKDLTLQGNGCHFVLHGDMSALAVLHSQNIVLENFSWDYACPTASQLTVKSVDAHSVVYEAAAGCDFQLRHGRVQWIFSKSPYTGQPYATAYNAHKSWSTVGYDPETGIQRRYNLTESPFSRAMHIQKEAPRTIRVTYFGAPPRPWCKPGMVAQMVASKRRPTAGAFFWESCNITAKGITVHYMHGFGWLTQMCRDVTFSACRFVPNAAGHYCTSYADLLHVSGAAGTVRVEDCVFTHAHDDPINIHGTFTRVEKRVDAHTLKLRYVHRQQGGFPQFHAGDEVVFYARDTLAPVTGNETRYTVVSARAPGENGDDAKTMTVTFSQPLPMQLTEKIGTEPAYVAENVTYTPNVIIRGCTFDHIPTRGILCTTRGKVCIENNRFDHMAMACIFLSNDSDLWYESGPVRDMVIRNNTFYVRETGQREWKDVPAVYVHPVVKGGRLPEVPVHRNITVENNTVHLFHDRAFVFESVENLTVRDNHLVRENGHTGEICSFAGCKNVQSDL